jgi:uncharacterized protein (TIGR03663 family)
MSTPKDQKRRLGARLPDPFQSTETMKPKSVQDEPETVVDRLLPAGILPAGIIPGIPNERLAWAVLAVLAVVSRLWMLGARVMSHDEALHVYYSWILSTGGGYAHNPMMHGPFLFEATGLFNALLGASDFSSRLLPALAGIGIVIGIPLLLRPWLGRLGSLAAGFLLLISPYILYYSRYNRHDLLVIGWTLLLVYELFAYLRHREERQLLYLAGTLALMFSTMETTFFYLAIFTCFLVVRLLVMYGLNWGAIRQAAEFDLVVVLATLGAFFSSPVALLVLNPLWMRFTGQPFVDVAVLDTFGIEWAATASGPRLWGLLAAFGLAAAAVGVWWGGKRWFKLAGIFLGITIALFTTLFTKWPGFGTGFVGSLGYWLSQQGVARGSQPWYYYLLVFPLYEYLPILLGLAAAGMYVLRNRMLAPAVRLSREDLPSPVGHRPSAFGPTLPRRGRREELVPAVPADGMTKSAPLPPGEGATEWRVREGSPAASHAFIPFLLWWGVVIFAGLTLAGEKMPWLSTHLTIPWILLAGWGLGRLLAGISLRPAGSTNHDHAGTLPAGRWIALGAAGVLVVLTLRTSYLVNYVNYDYTTEFIGFAHGAPGVKWALEDIETLARRTGQGTAMKVASDDEVAWPVSWYLRDYPGFFGADVSRDALADAAVVLVGPNNWSKTERLLSGGYHRYEVVRMWWPMEEYKNLTWERMRFALTDPEMRAALWDIVWRRDFTRYGQATGQEYSYDPPRRWVLEDRMRVYIRSDLAEANPDLVLADYEMEALPAPVDAYAGLRREVAPLQLLALPGLTMPRNLATAPDGALYVADSGSHRILKTGPDGGPQGGSQGGPEGEVLLEWGRQTPAEQVPPEPGTFQEPWGLAVDGAGHVYVADTWNHRIQKFDAGGRFLLEWGTGGVRDEGPEKMWGPRAVAIGTGGQVYVADTGNRRIAAFDSTGQFLYDFDSQGEALLDEPVGLAVGRDGSVYVADTWNARVAVFSADGQFITSWPVEGWTSASLDNKPYLAVDDLNRVYLTDPEGYRVIVFSADGQALAEFGQYGQDEASFGMPNGIAIGPGGEVWVADAGNNRLAAFPPLE